MRRGGKGRDIGKGADAHLQLWLRVSDARAPDQVQVVGGESVFHAAEEPQKLGGPAYDLPVDAVSEDFLHHLMCFGASFLGGKNIEVTRRDETLSCSCGDTKRRLN